MHRLAPRLLGIAAGQNESKPPRRNLRPKLKAWCKRTPRRRKLKVAHRLRVLCFAVWRSLRFYDTLPGPCRLRKNQNGPLRLNPKLRSANGSPLACAARPKACDRSQPTAKRPRSVVRPTPELSGAAGKPSHGAKTQPRVRLSAGLGCRAGRGRRTAWLLLFDSLPTRRIVAALRIRLTAPPPVEQVWNGNG